MPLTRCDRAKSCLCRSGRVSVTILGFVETHDDSHLHVQSHVGELAGLPKLRCNGPCASLRNYSATRRARWRLCRGLAITILVGIRDCAVAVACCSRIVIVLLANDTQQEVNATLKPLEVVNAKTAEGQLSWLGVIESLIHFTVNASRRFSVDRCLYSYESSGYSHTASIRYTRKRNRPSPFP